MKKTIGAFSILWLCALLTGCPVDGPGTDDEGEDPTGCDQDTQVSVPDMPSGTACSDDDPLDDVTLPSESNAGCTAEVGGMTVTSTAMAEVDNTVMTAGCSLENGGTCAAFNTCDFTETLPRTYSFKLDASLLVEGQAPAMPTGGSVTGMVSCSRAAGGFDEFPLVPGDDMELEIAPGDDCNYRIFVDTVGTASENSHVLATLTRESIGGDCAADVDCENPFYSFCQPDGFCGAGVFPDLCSDDTDCQVPNFKCIDETCIEAPGTGDVCDVSQDCDGSDLCTIDGSCTKGRAVVLDFATGTLPVGTQVCLTEVNLDGCTFLGAECETDGMSTLHLHRTITIDAQLGTFADPNGPGCGHGKVVGNTTCGFDFILTCS